jgi:hypothetical protein
MILKILSHSRKMLHDRNAEALQLPFISNSGLHQPFGV